MAVESGTGESEASGAGTTEKVKSGWYRSLFLQVLVAVAAGLLVGQLWPGLGADLKPLGDGFIS